jgi:hypothetical protein
VGGAEDAEKTRRIIALQEAIGALEEVEEPLMTGLVASMKSIVLVQKASPGEILAKALNDASIQTRTFSETLRNESKAEYAKVLESGHRFLAQTYDSPLFRLSNRKFWPKTVKFRRGEQKFLVGWMLSPARPWA